MSVNAVSVKNDLFQKLNECSSYTDYWEYVRTLKIILNNTKGFWAELGYCYKAIEIINATIDRLNGFILWLEANKLPPSAPNRGEMIDILTFKIGELCKLRNEYQALHEQGKTSS